MKVTPITAADAKAMASNCWPRGPYDFEVVEAYDKTSKNGNDMIELEVRVFNTEGRTRIIKDWLVESEHTSYKVRHFAESVGLLAEYDKGELKAHDLIGKTGRCKLAIEKDKNETYPDKNKITDYLTGATTAILTPSNDMPDDAIPF